jgi:RNA polymerase-binding transcription factor DksA
MADKKKPAKKAVPAKPASKPAAKPASKAPAKPAPKVPAKPASKAPAPKPAVKAAAKPAPKAPAKPAPKVEAAKPVKKIEAPAKPKKVQSLDEVEVPPIKAPAGPIKVSGFALKQRQRLLDLRDELVDAMSGMTGEIRNAPEGSEASGSGMHQGDAGSDAYDRDFALSVLAKEQDALYEIEQALRRIDRGVYGVCEMSGKSIPQARLEAIPFARLTVECQAQWEKEYGNRRFRPSNEVGFAGGHYQDDEDSETVSLDEDDD